MNTINKTCKDCKKEITEEEFSKKPGYMALCVPCEMERKRLHAKRFRTQNPEKVREYEKRRWAIHKQKRKEQGKKYREANIEKYKEGDRLSYLRNIETSKAYRLRNKEKIREYDRSDRKKELNKKLYIKNRLKQKERKAKFYKENKEKVIKRTTKYKTERSRRDHIYKMINKIRNHTFRAFKHASLKKNSKSFDLLGCTIYQFINHFESRFKEGMNWKNHGEWEIDHIIPLATLKGSDLESVKKLCHYTNLQPLWKEENRLKGNKIQENL